MKTITESQYKDAADQIGVEVSLIKAIEYVESGGRNGFISPGKPCILFEGHIFWRQLKRVGIDPENVLRLSEMDDILYPKYDRTKYKGGLKEYDRLSKALSINKEAAYNSVSVGAFQILGSNYRSCGFNSSEEYFKSSSESEYNQLLIFINFIKSYPNMIEFLKDKNFDEFAKLYNGSKCFSTYSNRIRDAYNRFK